MSVYSARKHLLDLRKQFEQHDFTDHQTNEKAKKLTGLIDHALTQESDKGLTDSTELQRHLKDSMLLFEVSHPTIATAINNIITTLMAIGV
jgi:hypothetical protein